MFTRPASSRSAATKPMRYLEAGPGGAGLNDPRDRPGIDRHGADAGQEGVAAVATARRAPDPPEDGAFVAERAGETGQQQRAVAQSGEVGRDRCQDLAQDVRGGGKFLAEKLAGRGGGAVHAGHGFADLGLGGYGSRTSAE
jgi:hypothetical protein